MIVKKALSYCLLLCLLLSVSCIQDEIDTHPGIVTEQIILITGDKVTATARILSTSNLQIDDHGFEVSTSVEFSEPFIESLGERSLPGVFVGTVTKLKVETQYYIRSYISINGQKTYSNTLNFSTLEPAIFSISPNNAEAGQKLTIVGKNLTDQVRVFFGNVEATILNIKSESIMEVTIPAPEIPNYIVTVRLTEDEESWESEDEFEYITGRWEIVAQFPAPLMLADTRYLAFENGLFFGLGRNSGIPYNRWWKFEPATLGFSEVTYSGLHTEFGNFTFDGGFGGGIGLVNNLATPIDSLWLINEDNTAFVPAGQLKLMSLYPVAVKRGQFLFLIGGQNLSQNPMTAIIRHNFNTNSSLVAGSTPFPVTNKLPYFTYQDDVYVFNEALEMWKYGFLNESWEYITRYPRNVLNGGIAVVLGNEVFIGLAKENLEMLKFNLQTGEWRPIVTLKDFNRNNTLGAWSFDDKIYVMRRANVFDSNNQSMVMWSFDPNNY